MKQTSLFAVRTQVSAQSLPRLLDFFAQLGLVPERVEAERLGEDMAVLIEQDGLDDAQARRILEKMRSAFLINSARLVRPEPAPARAPLAESELIEA